MTNTPILDVKPLGFQWETLDPFLFCVHHDDAYPAGNEHLGPAASLAGRNIGNDFAGIDGWRMYHGDVVPGFPQHPHRGFETVTLVRRGLIDHSDSLGATARFGGGDTQWMTAGEGVVHSEMFPLLARDQANPVELFQIWLNLPREDKLAPPHFTMLWSDTIPTYQHTDALGLATRVTVLAGALDGVTVPTPPPRSWAARSEADVAIWAINMEAGGTWTLPPARAGSNRMLYGFAGSSFTAAGQEFPARVGLRLAAENEVVLRAGDARCELLLLQGKPIGEPVVQYGPFVMNTASEIQQAMTDYRRTRFGGWPWASDGPVHPRERGRFAKHADGRVEERSTDLVSGPDEPTPS